MRKPTRALLVKYGNTKANIYKFKPVRQQTRDAQSQDLI